MKPKGHKGVLTLAFITLVSVCTIIFVIGVFLYQIPANQPSNPNNPTLPEDPQNPNNPENPSENPIETMKYKYLGISSDDTIRLYSESGEEFIISLENKKWINANWSPNGEYISVLGSGTSENEKLDLFLYTIKENTWKQITNLANSESGVLSYAWFDNDTLLFTQGIGFNEWIHRYNLSSGEILKVKRSNGTILDNKALRNVLYKDSNNNLSFIDNTGESVWDIYNLGEGLQMPDVEQSESKAKNVVLAPDLSKGIIIYENNAIYKSEYGTKSATIIQTEKELIPLCFVTNDLFLTYLFNPSRNIFEFYNVNTKTFVIEKITDHILSSNSFDKSKIYCDKDSNLFFGTKSNEWFQMNEDEIILEQSFLKNLIEVKAY